MSQRRWLLLSGVLLLAIETHAGCREHPERKDVAEAKPPAIEESLDDADRLLDERRYRDAEAIYARALEELPPSSETSLHWRALFGLARTRLTLGAHEDAKSRLDELRALAAGIPVREARTAHLAAAVLHREGDLESAEREAELSLDWARRSDDWKLVVRARSMLATIYSLSGRHADALRIDEALIAQLRETAAGSLDLAQQMNELGIDYRHFGRFGDAISIFQESLSWYRSHEDIEGEAMVLYNLASVYSQMGDVGGAMALKLESLERAERIGHTYGLGLLNEDIGEAYLETGNPRLAKEHLEKALSINRSAHQARGEIASLQSLGRLDLEAGRLDRARTRLREAKALAEEHGYGEEALTAHIALSEVATRAGALDEALRLADRAFAQAVVSSDPEVEFDALRARARALERANRLEESVALDLQGITLLESWRGRLALGDLRLGVSRPRWDVFESAVRGLFALGRVTEAFEISEHAKSRLLLELMVDRSGTTPADTPEQRLRSQLRERFAAWKRVNEERRGEIEAEIEELADALVDLEASGNSLSPWTSAARFPAPLSATEIEESIVTPHVGLLAYLWGERDVYGWSLGPGGIHGRRLGSTSELRALVEFLRLAIETRDTPAEWRGVAERAYRRLVAPLFESKTREIRIVADGPLTLIPFEVMISGAGEAPLGLTHVLSYGPSASVLAALSKRKRLAPEGESLLALAYSPPDGGGGARATPRAERLGPIPAAEAEAEFITGLYRGADARLLEGNDASFAQWKSAAPERYRLLHFATHARTNETRSNESYLLLSDGKFTASRIRALRLEADLVTLSACETALGYRVRGEGVVGLAHAFLAAGAGATLVSLWRVDDRRTARFMEEFYGRLRSGSRPAEALLEARRAFVDAGRRHPSDWAAFVLVGKP